MIVIFKLTLSFIFSAGSISYLFRSERHEIFKFKKVDEHYCSVPICAKSSSNLPILEGTYEECQEIC